MLRFIIRRGEGANVPQLLCFPMLGNEDSAQIFSDRSVFEPSWGHGRLHLRVMDVRTEMFVLPGFGGVTKVFAP